MTAAVPARVRLLTAANRIEIAWSDGRETTYPGPWLRRICPCAACRGHVPGEVEPPTAEQVAGVRVVQVEAVGAYALRFDFSDGHGSGIYSYAWLREKEPGPGEDE